MLDMKKFIVLLFFCFISNVTAQTLEIKEGVGVRGLVVGSSSLKDVEARLGKPDKVVLHKKYSKQLLYRELGLSFYSCQSDKKQRIFVIEIKRPFKGKTTRGIELGSSNRKDVEKLYGSGNKKYRGKEYRGVEFYYTPTKKGEIVTGIDIFEKTGIRQCKAGK
jgi:hypothetical protein